MSSKLCAGLARLAVCVFLLILSSVFMLPGHAFATDQLTVPGLSTSKDTGLGEALQSQTVTEMPEWDGVLFSSNPALYDNALALKAAEICENAYPSNSKNIMNMFAWYGFEDAESHNYSENYEFDPDGESERVRLEASTNSSAYSVGHSELSINGEDCTVLVVVARGTQSPSEMVGDAVKYPKVSFLDKYEVWNNVNDFYKAVNEGVARYVAAHDSVKVAASGGKLKVLVTGHSLGGAAACMYAAKLISSPTESWERKLTRNDVYAYTFGAIKVLTSDSNVEFGLDGIHNVYNHLDSWGPESPKCSYGVSSPNAKFGHTDEFYAEYKEEGAFDLTNTPNHDMSTYREALEKGYVACAAKHQCKIVFNANGGVGFMADQFMSAYDVGKLNANKFVNAGHEFTGWNRNKDGSGKKYEDASEVYAFANPGDTVMLYAQWKTLSYQVAFNANGGSGKMANQTIARDTKTSLKANSFKKAGYSFTGWNTKKNGKGASFKNKQSVKNLAKANSKVTLYAQWKAAKYVVAFQPNGGTGSMKAQEISPGKKTALSANKFKRSGYKFTGWNTKKNGKGKAYANKAKVKDLAKKGKTVKLYAQWKKNPSSPYLIKTKDYSFKIPKYWQGKVTWKTTTHRFRNKWNVWVNHYKTDIYLKGHMGDSRYLVADVRSGAVTGFGGGFEPVVTKMMKTQDNQYVNNLVVVMTKNIPYFIWYSKKDANWATYLPTKLKDQKKLLDLATCNRVSYKAARQNADYGSSAYNAVRKYQKAAFASTLKVLR